MNKPPQNRRQLKTCLRHVVRLHPTQCYVCGKLERHRYWDPESNGDICTECLVPYMTAEQLLLLTPGITRPNSPAKEQ